MSSNIHLSPCLPLPTLGLQDEGLRNGGLSDSVSHTSLEGTEGGPLQSGQIQKKGKGIQMVNSAEKVTREKDFLVNVLSRLVQDSNLGPIRCCKAFP